MRSDIALTELIVNAACACGAPILSFLCCSKINSTIAAVMMIKIKFFKKNGYMRAKMDCPSEYACGGGRSHAGAHVRGIYEGRGPPGVYTFCL